MAGGNFTRGFAAREIPREAREVIAAPPPLARSRIPPATQAICFLENKGVMLQTLQVKQKYQATNVGVENIKLSRLLVRRIYEFNINEIRRKIPQ